MRSPIQVAADSDSQVLHLRLGLKQFFSKEYTGFLPLNVRLEQLSIANSIVFCETNFSIAVMSACTSMSDLPFASLLWSSTKMQGS